MKLSVVVATYNRLSSLEQLLSQLALQAGLPGPFEVVVVDDGSASPVAPALENRRYPFTLTVHTQQNAGAAAARDVGVRRAQGELVVIIDDDMQVDPDFLRHHLACHADGERTVVIGRIAADDSLATRPLFERWHQALLDRMARQLASGEVVPGGKHFFTGNVSLPRRAFLEVGGFDSTMRQSEDVELGLRLEKAGLKFKFADDAVTRHASDHSALAFFRRRAFRYGGFDRELWRKHPDRREASPWRFWTDLNRLTVPFLATALLAPEMGETLGTAVLAISEAVDRLGAERAAYAGTTLGYSIDYFRGVRSANGTLGATFVELCQHLSRFDQGHTAAWARVCADLAEDQRVMRRNEHRYGHHTPSDGKLLRDTATKIGLQMLAAYRVMRALRELRLERAAKVVSRAIRHLYGSDIHWDAELAPGVMIVHGMGMAISHAARVGRGCTLFQHVTLGVGMDPISGKTGAPTLEENVSVGAGAVLVGPITIGANAKIMAGAVVTESVPPGVVVETPRPTIRQRKTRRNEVIEPRGLELSAVDGPRQ